MKFTCTESATIRPADLQPLSLRVMVKGPGFRLFIRGGTQTLLSKNAPTVAGLLKGSSLKATFVNPFESALEAIF